MFLRVEEVYEPPLYLLHARAVELAGFVYVFCFG